jgi:hypothetical protein
LTQLIAGLVAQLVAMQILIDCVADELVALTNLLVDEAELALVATQVRLPFSCRPRRAFFQVHAVVQILPDD